MRHASPLVTFLALTVLDLRHSINELETHAEADRGGLALALRYVRAVPQIRRLRAANWERCRVTA